MKVLVVITHQVQAGFSWWRSVLSAEALACAARGCPFSLFLVPLFLLVEGVCQGIHVVLGQWFPLLWDV